MILLVSSLLSTFPLFNFHFAIFAVYLSFEYIDLYFNFGVFWQLPGETDGISRASLLDLID
jgi:hypothetical protein